MYEFYYDFLSYKNPLVPLYGNEITECILNTIPFIFLFVTGRKGRPRINIPVGQLRTFAQLNFSAPQMAKMLGCKTRTVKYRLRAAGIRLRNYSALSMDQLKLEVAKVHQNHPNAGIKVRNV